MKGQTRTKEKMSPLIHVGYPKTGSSWFQKCVLGEQHTELMQIADWTAVRRIVVRPHPLCYDQRLFVDHVRPGIQECEKQGKVPVISQELLTGIPDSGGHNNTILADRLHDVFPNARILIVIREQRAFLLSVYKEYVRNGGKESLYRYLHPASVDRYPSFDFHYLEFDRLIQYYYQLFGTSNVLVLPFEQLVKDPLSFCNSILQFADAKPLCEVVERQERSGLNGLTIAVMSCANSVLYRDKNTLVAPPTIFRKLDKIAPFWLGKIFDRRLKSTIANAVQERYCKSNEICSSLIGVNLSEFGYMTGSDK